MKTVVEDNVVDVLEEGPLTIPENELDFYNEKICEKILAICDVEKYEWWKEN